MLEEVLRKNHAFDLRPTSIEYPKILPRYWDFKNVEKLRKLLFFLELPREVQEELTGKSLMKKVLSQKEMGENAVEIKEGKKFLVIRVSGRLLEKGPEKVKAERVSWEDIKEALRKFLEEWEKEEGRLEKIKRHSLEKGLFEVKNGGKKFWWEKLPELYIFPTLIGDEKTLEKFREFLNFVSKFEIPISCFTEDYYKYEPWNDSSRKMWLSYGGLRLSFDPLLAKKYLGREVLDGEELSLEEAREIFTKYYKDVKRLMEEAKRRGMVHEEKFPWYRVTSKSIHVMGELPKKFEEIGKIELLIEVLELIKECGLDDLVVVSRSRNQCIDWDCRTCTLVVPWEGFENLSDALKRLKELREHWKKTLKDLEKKGYSYPPLPWEESWEVSLDRMKEVPKDKKEAERLQEMVNLLDFVVSHGGKVEIYSQFWRKITWSEDCMEISKAVLKKYYGTEGLPEPETEEILEILKKVLKGKRSFSPFLFSKKRKKERSEVVAAVAPVVVVAASSLFLLLSLPENLVLKAPTGPGGKWVPEDEPEEVLEEPAER